MNVIAQDGSDEAISDAGMPPMRMLHCDHPDITSID